jgi:hypothetical protein
MGKCSVRMKDPEKIPFELFGELAEKMSPEQWVKHYQAAREGSAAPKARGARPARAAPVPRRARPSSGR